MAEGNTDQRLYSKFIDPKNAKIIPAFSKTNVVNVVNKMVSRRDGKVIGIVDRDLDELKGRIYSPPIFYTDYRDLEMMLINSNALEEVLIEYGDPDMIERFKRANGDIREAIIESAYPLGLLMYVSHVRGYNLNFKNLSFTNFIDKRTLRVDLLKMVQTVIDSTFGCELSKRAVLKDLQAHMSDYEDKKSIARGHDTVKVLLIGLKDTFGSYNSTSLNEGALGGALRLAFSLEEFNNTELYSAVLKWASDRNLRIWQVIQNRSPRP